MLTIRTFRPDSPDYEEIRRLYDANFPDDERIPWNRLTAQLSQSRIMHVYYDEDTLIGLSYVFIHKDIAYLGYLAVEENLRNQGYGSKILQAIRKELSDCRIVIDIEVVDKNAENYEERKRRKDFYLHNGFVSTGAGYYFYHVDYELLSANGIVKAEEYRDLILEHWGPIAANAVFRKIEQ